MRYFIRTSSALFFTSLPLTVLAAGSIQSGMVTLVRFINSTFIPFLMAMAMIFFIWNAFRFFIVQGSNTEGQDKAKQLMYYGLGAFVLILSIWGVVNLGARALGIDRQTYICPDYMPGCTSQTNFPAENSGINTNHPFNSTGGVFGSPQ